MMMQQNYYPTDPYCDDLIIRIACRMAKEMRERMPGPLESEKYVEYVKGGLFPTGMGDMSKPNPNWVTPTETEGYYTSPDDRPYRYDETDQVMVDVTEEDPLDVQRDVVILGMWAAANPIGSIRRIRAANRFWYTARINGAPFRDNKRYAVRVEGFCDAIPLIDIFPVDK